jgi:hypothetical protein
MTSWLNRNAPRKQMPLLHVYESPAILLPPPPEPVPTPDITTTSVPDRTYSTILPEVFRMNTRNQVIYPPSHPSSRPL